jgi:uncharacterized protein
VLVDANILLYAVDSTSRSHAVAKQWLERALNGNRRVGLPWPSLTAFVRIATNARAMEHPLSAAAAWRIVTAWLERPTVWIPLPTEHHAQVLGTLIVDLDLRGNLVPDAVLAALAIEHGLIVCSADSDFARFPDVRWENPLAT